MVSAPAPVLRPSALERETRPPDDGIADRLIEATVAAAVTLLQSARRTEALALLDALRDGVRNHAPRCTAVGFRFLAAAEIDEALRWFDCALAVEPAFAAALFGCAKAMQLSNRLDEAVSLYDRGIAIDPSRAAVFFERGTILRRLGHREKAIASFDKALQIQPAYPAALQAGGEILAESGHIEAALAFYDEALRLDPTLFPTWFDKGCLLQKLNRLEDAAAAFDTAHRLVPTNADALTNRGVVECRLGLFDRALASQQSALRLRPAFPQALCNRGSVLLATGRPREALGDYEAALRLMPHYPEAACNRAVSLQALGQIAAAREAFEAAAALDPAFAPARKNRAIFDLLCGDFERGFEDYELRLAEPGHRAFPPLDCPRWPGPPTPIGRIVVFDEQGNGDVIMFARYLPLLVVGGGTVTFVCRASLHRLLRGLHPAIVLADAVPENCAFDHRIPLASLPRAFGTRVDTILSFRAYLTPEGKLAATWAKRLAGKGLRVGLCWRGSVDNRQHASRSVPLDLFAPLAAIAGIRLISLQKAEDEASSATAPWLEQPAGALDAGPDAFVETAAIIANLDLVVTCDTAIAHLAGALGTPVWVLLKHSPDWRWLLDRDDSPWYPSMRLFRQATIGDWRSAIDAVVAALPAFATHSGAR